MLESRSILADHLVITENYVAEGEESIARQAAIIDQLNRDGHDTTRARALLALFEELQTFHVEDRNRLRAKIAKEQGQPFKHHQQSWFRLLSW